MHFSTTNTNGRFETNLTQYQSNEFSTFFYFFFLKKPAGLNETDLTSLCSQVENTDANNVNNKIFLSEMTDELTLDVIIFYSY